MAKAVATEEQGFVKNVGQLEGPAGYYARSTGSSVYFEPGSVRIDRAPQSIAEKGIALRVEFPNAGASHSTTGPRARIAREHLPRI